jgi:hypothetical protein
MGFAVWLDERERVAWAQGTHEYRPMGTAAVAICGQFRPRDFRISLKRPANLATSFVGFFGSLETVNEYLSAERVRRYLSNPRKTDAVSSVPRKEQRVSSLPRVTHPRPLRYRATPAHLL